MSQNFLCSKASDELEWATMLQRLLQSEGWQNNFVARFIDGLGLWIGWLGWFWR